MIYYCVSEILTLHTNHSPVDMLAKVGFGGFGFLVTLLLFLWLGLTWSLLCSPGWLSRCPLASAFVGLQRFDFVFVSLFFSLTLLRLAIH